jgi:hypothetical protein
MKCENGHKYGVDKGLEGGVSSHFRRPSRFSVREHLTVSHMSVVCYVLDLHALSQVTEKIIKHLSQENRHPFTTGTVTFRSYWCSQTSHLHNRRSEKLKANELACFLVVHGSNVSRLICDVHFVSPGKFGLWYLQTGHNCLPRNL